MHCLGLEVHDARLARERQAARLLYQEGHGRCLIQQAQLAVRVLGVSRVTKDAPVEQRPVHVTHHRPNVARRVLHFGLALAGLQGRDVLLQRLVPVPTVGLVHRVDLTPLGNLDIRVRQHELADGPVVGEACATSPRSQFVTSPL